MEETKDDRWGEAGGGGGTAHVRETGGAGEGRGARDRRGVSERERVCVRGQSGTTYYRVQTQVQGMTAKEDGGHWAGVGPWRRLYTRR